MEPGPGAKRGKEATMRRPRRLYETPPSWGGETFYLSRHEAEKAVRELKQGDWCVSIADCRVWYNVGGDEYEEPRSRSRRRFRYNRSYEAWEPYELVWEGGSWREKM